MNRYDKYVELVQSNKDNVHVPKKTQSHHILPVSYFTSRKLIVDNSSNNRIEFCYKDHMIAHLYLSGCTKGRDRYKNLYSLFQLSHFDKEGYLNIQNYEKYQQLYEEAISAAPNHRKGTKCSDETREKIRIARQQATAEQGSFTKGTVWVNNGSIEKMVKLSDKEHYLLTGFTEGRIYRHDKEILDKIANCNRNRTITDEFRKKMSEIAKISNANRDESWKIKMIESKKKYFETHDSYWKGRHHSEESKKRISEKKKGRVRIDKGSEYKNVLIEEVNRYIEQGWSVHQNKEYVKVADWVFITDGIVNKKVHTDELEYYMNQGFKCGVTKKKS